VKDPFKLEEVEYEEWIDRIAHFRVEVWKLNDMVDMTYFPDNKCLEEVDKKATHKIVQWQGRLIAATRYTHYPDLDSTHHGDYYRRGGIDLQGPIGIPEHTVVHPDFAGRGLGKAITDSYFDLGRRNKVRFHLSENTPVNAELLRNMGRKSLGMAPPDPRFPGIQFEWMCMDIESHYSDSKAKD